jgi:hypothetical protein
MNITWKDALDWWSTNDDLINRIDRIMDWACLNFWGASDMPALADKFLRPHFDALCDDFGVISDDDFDIPDWSAAKAILDSMADKAINDIKDLV